MTVKQIIPTHYEMETGDTPPTGVRRPVTTLRDILTNAMYITYDGGDNWIVADKRVRLTSERGDFIPRPQYRVPYLRTGGVGVAEWSRERARYGQWAAKLTGGAQSDYDDYAAVSWNEDKMLLSELEEILWVYRMSAEEVAAPNVAIHVHDPEHPERRADISLSHTHDDLGKTVGWHEFSLVDAVGGLFYYGNNIPDTCGLVAHGVASDMYTLAQYKADPVFSTYVISRITIEWGYYSAGTFDAVHIVKVEVNGADIPLMPSAEERLSFGGNVYVNSNTSAEDTARRFETTPKKLRDVTIIVKTKAQVFGTSASQTYPVAADGTIGITQIEISTLYFKHAVAGEDGTVHILGVEE